MHSQRGWEQVAVFLALWPPSPWPGALVTAKDSPSLSSHTCPSPSSGFPSCPFLSRARTPGSTDTHPRCRLFLLCFWAETASQIFPVCGDLAGVSGHGQVLCSVSFIAELSYDSMVWGRKSQEKCHRHHVASRVSAVSMAFQHRCGCDRLADLVFASFSTQQGLSPPLCTPCSGKGGATCIRAS